MRYNLGTKQMEENAEAMRNAETGAEQMQRVADEAYEANEERKAKMKKDREDAIKMSKEDEKAYWAKKKREDEMINARKKELYEYLDANKDKMPPNMGIRKINGTDFSETAMGVGKGQAVVDNLIKQDK